MRLASQLTPPVPLAEKTTAGTILPQEVTVHGDTTDGAFALTMPAASEALLGVIYTVRLVRDNGDLTVVFPGGDYDPDDQVLDDVGDTVNAYSDGIYWHNLVTALS